MCNTNTTNTTNITNTTNTSNSSCRVEPLQGVGYSVVFLLGFLVNAVALRVFITKHRFWTDTHVYIFNLVIADSALVLFLPFRVWDAFFCLDKNRFCTVLIFIHFINMYASIMTTMAISVHRYLLIRFPLQARSWRKRKETAFAVCLVFWGLIVTICVIFREDNSPQKLWTCYERCKNIPLKPLFIAIVILLGFLTPLLIVVFCSSRIIYILLKDDDKSEEKRSTVGIVTANMAVFIFCYTPIHIGFLVNYFAKVPEDWHVNSEISPAHMFLLVAEWIASTNCCFDSISYFFLLKRFYS